MPLPINLAVVERNSMFREGVQRILSDVDFPVHWSAARAEDLPTIEQADPWLLLLFADNEEAAADGEAIRELNHRFPSARIVLLGSEFDFAKIRTAFSAAVYGFLVNDIACDRLVGLLRLVALGQKVFPSQLAIELVDLFRTDTIAGTAPNICPADLSRREMEVLRCLILGLPSKVISRRLLICEATVEVHVKAILRKLHAKNRTQAAIWGSSRGVQALENDNTLAAIAAPKALSHA